MSPVSLVPSPRWRAHPGSVQLRSDALSPEIHLPIDPRSKSDRRLSRGEELCKNWTTQKEKRQRSWGKLSQDSPPPALKKSAVGLEMLRVKISIAEYFESAAFEVLHPLSSTKVTCSIQGTRRTHREQRAELARRLTLVTETLSVKGHSLARKKGSSRPPLRHEGPFSE